MLQVTFDYPIKNQNLQVLATCKSVLGSEYVEGLSLTFLNESDERVKVLYDKELFDDIESEAVYLLADAYFNPELNFKH